MTFLIETQHTDNNTDLYVFSRDKSGTKHIEKVTDFNPYIYVPAGEFVPDDNRIVKIESGFITLDDKQVKRIWVDKATNVKGVASLFSKDYENQVSFAQRYIIDKIGEAPVYKLKTLCIDIETDSDNTFPDIEHPDQKIISCSFVDNFGNKRVFFLPEENNKIKIIEHDYLTIVESEEALIAHMIKYIRDNSPDVLTGWNCNNFDIPYFFNRAKKYNLDVRQISPLNTAFVKPDNKKDGHWNVIIKGMIVLDMLDAYKHYRKLSNQGKAESYSLEYTAQDVLGKGKLQHTPNFHEFWVKDPNKMIEYNLRDSDLVIELDNELDIIHFFNYIRSKACAQFSQIFQTTALIDGFLLHLVKDKLVLPSKPRNKEENKYAGAFVIPPIPGLYDNILAEDIKGMYPNIIKTFNVSYETFNKNGQIKLNSEIGFDAGNGLLKQAMILLEKERGVYKKLKKDATTEQEKKVNHYKQYAIKVLMNAHYGYLGYPGSRLYKREIAEAVTVWGQEILKHSKRLLEKHDYKIVYGDTDSLYIQGKETSLINLIKEGRDLSKMLNNSYIDFAKQYGSDDCSIEMEFEKIFKKILFVSKRGTETGAKKKYAYLLSWEDGKVISDPKPKYKGFGSVRSDSARISKITQQHILDLILHGSEKEDIIEHLKSLDKKIRTGNIDLEDISFPKGISAQLSSYGKESTNNDTGKVRKTGIPPVIHGALYANKYLGQQFNQGSKPKWIYIKRVPRGYPDTHVLSFEHDIPKGFVIDYDKLIDRLFKMKLDKIFEAAGFGEFPMINSEQTTLF